MDCQPSSSSSLGVEWWWKYLWNLKIPAKIRIFIWKACHNWLLTLTNIAKRGVPMKNGCGICFKKPETIVHDLWGCGDLKEFRNSCYLFNELKWDKFFQFQDILLYYSQVLSKREMELLCVIF
ncbi:hypothetical protein Ddye_024482 [Dipteronia dyeriana]|uniref:Reverse transcriptase zinc-binding domain-containing protein n=1 Tax=Dipteronia dyeriana TaxID=168575 RepID=A0AAD9WT04_9ROSI|nr:hypothetical protein Ddye_024482 [Dipteronia dyeriana]